MTQSYQPNPSDSTPIGKVLNALARANRRINRTGPDKYMAQCPGPNHANGDQHPSLSIGIGKMGGCVIRCMSASCSNERIVETIGLKMADLMARDPSRAARVPMRRKQSPTKNGGSKVYPTMGDAVKGAAWIMAKANDLAADRVKLAGKWDYRDAGGELVAAVVRVDLPTVGADGKQEKDFRPVHSVAAGWKIGDPAGKWPPYRLPDVLAAVKGGVRRVYVTEGEKACDATTACGLVATTSAHGSKSPGKTDWMPLAGLGVEVVILPDNDEAGRGYADTVAGILMGLSPALVVKVVALPDLPAKGDFDDLQAECRDGQDAESIRAEVDALADRAPVWVAPVDTQNAEAPANDSELWPDPKSLPNDLPPVMPFNYDLLPAPFVPWIRDISERMQCSPDYCAVAAMVALGTSIGRKVGIRPKQRDDWMEVANIWGLSIGRPGLMKTPAMAEPLKPISRLECDAAREHSSAMLEFEAIKLVAAEKKKVGAKAVREALEVGTDAKAIARKAVCEEAAEPIRKRFMTNDSTVEKLGVILSQNPNGVLIFRDEMSAFLRTMDREGHEADRGFYLEAWNGKGRFTYDRIGRGTLDIESAIVSILGSIQPGPLQEYLRGAIAGGLGDDGLMQRFQLAVWPDISATWRNVDRWPEANIRDGAFEVFNRLVELTPDSVKAERDKSDPDAIPFLRFDDAAQIMFDSWRARLEAALRSGKDHPAVEAHLSKYRKLVPALALIIHLAEASVGPIREASLAKAILWAQYLESHARRIYAGVTKAAQLSARALAARIIAGEVLDGFALRDVYRNGWSMLANRDDALAAVDVLTSLDWLHEHTVPTEGRDRTRYLINPATTKNSETLKRNTDKTDKCPPVPPFVSSVSSPSLTSSDLVDDRDWAGGDPNTIAGA